MAPLPALSITPRIGCTHKKAMSKPNMNQFPKHSLLDCGLKLLKVTCNTIDDFIRFVYALEGKSDVLLLITLTEKNHALFDEIGSVSQLRHHKKDYFIWRRKSGYIGLYYGRKKECVHILFGGLHFHHAKYRLEAFLH
jgi:hypothetical protein